MISRSALFLALFFCLAACSAGLAGHTGHAGAIHELPLPSARALFNDGDRARQEGDSLAAERLWTRVACGAPGSWWARRSLEGLHKLWQTLPPTSQEQHLSSLVGCGDTGQLLYYSALAWKQENPARAMALCDFSRREDPKSVFRDECEDLYFSLLSDPEEQIRYLELLLVPLPHEDETSMLRAGMQELEYRLGKLHYEQGRFRESVDRLLRCVNLYPSWMIRKKALLLLVDAARMAGDKDLSEKSRKALGEYYGR